MQDQRIPAFQCFLSLIFATYKGRLVKCEAFDIQVRREDAQKFVHLACKALPAQGPKSIILYSERYQHPHRFAAAVMLQANQDDHRIVAVKAISEFEMFGFEGTLRREFSQILGFYRNHTTALGNPANQAIGRWNLLCTKAEFNDLATSLHKRLEALFKLTSHPMGVFLQMEQRRLLLYLDSKGSQ
jgi:hypothetical protein